MEIWLQELIGVLLNWMQFFYVLIAHDYVFTYSDAYNLPYEDFPLPPVLQAPLKALKTVDMPDAVWDAFWLSNSIMFPSLNDLFSMCCHR